MRGVPDAAVEAEPEGSGWAGADGVQAAKARRPEARSGRKRIPPWLGYWK